MHKFLGMAVSCVLFASMAYADNLNQILSYSYENNLTLLADRESQKITDEDVSKAKSGYRPYISADGSIGKSHNSQEFLNTAGKQTYNQTPKSMQLSVNQSIFSGFSTVNAVQSAKKRVQAGRNALLTSEQAILLQTAMVYMDVIRDKAVLELQKNQEKVLNTHLDSYRKRFKAGSLTRTDVAQSEARAAGATAARIAADGQLKMSEAMFYSVVGVAPNELEDVQQLNFQLPHTLTEAMDLALRNNPQILAARYAQEAARYTITAQKGALLPSLNVGGAIGRAEENMSVDRNDYWQIKANVSVPLYQSGTEYANIRQAKLTENRYRILWNKAMQDVHADVISAWEKYTATKAQIESIEAQIKASKLALDGVIREAKVGSRTVLDVLDAEQEHLDNRVALVRAHHDEIVAAFSLMSAIGGMNPVTLGLSVTPYDPKQYYEEVKNKWLGYSTDY